MHHPQEVICACRRAKKEIEASTLEVRYGLYPVQKGGMLLAGMQHLGFYKLPVPPMGCQGHGCPVPQLAMTSLLSTRSQEDAPASPLR